MSTSVRERAIQAYKKAKPDSCDWSKMKIVAVKCRSKKIIRVFLEGGNYGLSWSYESGKLRRLAA